MTTSILLAGGGTGGHIYPNVAVAERVAQKQGAAALHFLVSDRAGDAQILSRLGYAFAASSVKPLPPITRPWRLVGFYAAWRKSLTETRQLFERLGVAAVVATGGFVSGPAIVTASELGIPCAMVNLDAIPGKANRRLSRYQPEIFSTYKTPLLPGARLIGLPLRKASLGDMDVAAARAMLGLDEAKPTLFVTGATHGAESVIRAMMALVAAPAHRPLFAGWQVFHQCGTFDPALLQAAYDNAGVSAKVVAYCDRMGAAWRAADVAISRAGAGSVAEAWANATPTIFLPNPYHQDQHQRHNAEPVVAAGGARLLTDLIDPQANLGPLGDALSALMRDAGARDAMRAALESTRPPDGAEVVADWIASRL